MSLTSLLRNNEDVRERFYREFSLPVFAVRKPLLAAALTTNYALVGTAFDYVLRFYLQNLNPRAAVQSQWIAEASLLVIPHGSPLFRQVENTVEQAKAQVEKFLQTDSMSDELLRSALQLAQLDCIYREGMGSAPTAEIDANDIRDLRNLISILDSEQWQVHRVCLLNPTFGGASRLVGGADADLVLDDTLIDIKTTKYLELKRRDFDQLLGYYTLHTIGGIGEVEPKIRIDKLAIYFSRHAYLHVFEIEKIVNPRTFPDFVMWFEQRAKQEKSSRAH